MLRSPLLWIACLGTVLLFGAPARGADSPMMAAYRAYTAAIESGDLNEAERQAALALEAAEKAESKKRGILAINLATARLDLGKRSEAIAPANRAAELLQQGDSDLDPVLVELIQARSQLDAEQSKSVNRSIKAIKSAQDVQIKSPLIYDFAVETGLILIKLRKHQDALEIWQIARGAAQSEIDKISPLLHMAISDIYLDEAKKGIALIDEAMALAVPYLPRERTAWTPADFLYSKLRAWRAVGLGTLSNDERKRLNSLELAAFSIPDPGLCPLRVIPKPFPKYPSRQVDKGSIASLVMGFDAAEDGTISNVVILASAPQIDDFSQSILKVAPSWRVEKAKDAAPGCKLVQTKTSVLINFVVPE